MYPSGIALCHPAAASLLQYATRHGPTLVGSRNEGSDRPRTAQICTFTGSHQTPPGRGSQNGAGGTSTTSGLEQYKRQSSDTVKTLTHINDTSQIEKISHHLRPLLSCVTPGCFTGTIGKQGINKNAPQGAIDQIGHSLNGTIHAFASTAPNEKVCMAKRDIKDGFWHLDYKEGEE